MRHASWIIPAIVILTVCAGAASYSLEDGRDPSDPAPAWAGTWRNQRDSEMELAVDDQGRVTGRYRTGVGSPEPGDWHSLVGLAAGDLIAFVVEFRWESEGEDYASLTSWSGQHTVEQGAEKILTQWDVAVNVADADEAERLWGAVRAGSSEFRRHR